MKVEHTEERKELLEHFQNVIKHLRKNYPMESITDFVRYLVNANVITVPEMEQQLSLSEQEKNQLLKALNNH